MHTYGKIGAFLRLIRWKNLVMIALTMFLMRYAIIEPLAGNVTINITHDLANSVPLHLHFSLLNFLILVFSTVCIAAGGYVINDYFDVKADSVNNKKVVVGNEISYKSAMLWSNILSLLGVVAGFYVSYKAGYVWFGVIFFLVSGLLYFYSASYKNQFLVGNIIIALLVSMVPLLVVFFEWSAIFAYCSAFAVVTPDFSFLFYWVGGFALFSFILTFIRELVKDVEDVEGDLSSKRKTVPIVIGRRKTKNIVLVLSIFTIALLYVIWRLYVFDWITFAYITIAVVAPLVIAVIILFKDKENERVHHVSSLLKIVMLTGVCYSVIVKLILSLNLL